MVVSGGLYATYHLLGEPETTIEILLQIDGVLPPWMRKTAEKKFPALKGRNPLILMCFETMIIGTFW